MLTSKVIILANANPPKGVIKPDTFKVETRTLEPLQDGQVLLKSIALGNLPSLRTWLEVETRPPFAPTIEKGDVIRAFGISEIVESRSERYKPRQRVTSMIGWREYAVVQAGEIMGPAATSDLISLTVLGVNGLTAWVGAFREMNLKPEHTLLISGAAGSIGSCLVQIAKHVIGCKRVVGIAGGKDKCDWIKSLGADECVDYKSPSFSSDLAAALPEETDFFFDNVGGEVLNEALTRVKRYGTIIICGATSGYNGEPQQLANWREVIYNRYTIKGFIAGDHAKDFGLASQELSKWVMEGKLTVDGAITVVDTKFEDIPRTWMRLFSGESQGTLITKLV